MSNFKLQMPVVYVPILVMFLTGLFGLRIFAVDISNLVEGKMGAHSPTTIVVTIIITALCFMLGTFSYMLARQRNAEPIIVSYSNSKGEKVKIVIGPRQFVLVIQWPTVLTGFGVAWLDTITGDITAIGWLAFGAAFAFIAASLYGLYEIITAKRESLPPANAADELDA